MKKTLLSLAVSGFLVSGWAVSEALLVVTKDDNTCTTNNDYMVVTHTMGESSFSNDIIYFRTLTPYTLSLYYKTPTNLNSNEKIDLNSFQLPNTNYKFFLEISSVLATGEAFYVEGNGTCYKAYFPKIGSEKEDVKLLTKDEFDNLGNGWHLIGTGATINDMSIFGESKNTIWTFENNSWINNIEEIKPLQGFWIKK